MPQFVDKMCCVKLSRTVAGKTGLSVEDHLHKRPCEFLAATLGDAAP
jgi:hypothetical protein